jgi:hemerythrin-like domain-containing protein
LRAEVEEFWKGDLKPHFAAEEEMIRIFAAHAGAADPDVTRILSDHRTMEQLVKKGFKEDLLRLSDILTKHIRYEEDVFFGRIEKILTPAEIRVEEEMLLKKAVPVCVSLPKPGKGF